MDIISEILNTDKLAEDKLKAAEAEKQNIIAEAKNTEEKMRAEADRLVQEYAADKQKKVGEDIDRKLDEINKDADGKVAALDSLYEQKHFGWEQDIFDRIIGASD